MSLRFSCQVGGLKGKTMKKGGGPKCSYTREARIKGNKKISFILKLIPKIKSRENGGKRQSSNQKQQGKVATKRKRDKVQPK